MYICVYIHIICMCISTYTRICKKIIIYIYVYVCTQIYVCKHLYVYTYIYIYISIHVSVCMSMSYICTYFVFGCFVCCALHLWCVCLINPLLLIRLQLNYHPASSDDQPESVSARNHNCGSLPGPKKVTKPVTRAQKALVSKAVLSSAWTYNTQVVYLFIPSRGYIVIKIKTEFLRRLQCWGPGIQKPSYAMSGSLGPIRGSSLSFSTCLMKNRRIPTHA